MQVLGGCQVELSESSVKRLSFQSFGLSATVTLHGDVSSEAMLPYLPPNRAPVSGAGADRNYVIDHAYQNRSSNQPRYRVFFEKRLLAQSSDLEECFSALEGDLSMAIATDSRHGLVFVHSGVVSLGDGALLIPGTSRSGKSTLVDVLVARGALYCSDEYAVIDGEGLVWPYLRQISLRTENCLGSGKKVSMQRFEGRIAMASTPLPVTGILGCQYRAGSDWSCHPATPGQGVLQLLENAVSAQLDPGRTMKILSRAANGAKVKIGTRGEASDAVESIWRCFDSSNMGEA